MRQYHKIQTSR